ncbi:MAG: hypothetical protein MPJ79_01165, partial [Alphaproteobacteria bacterium]|nr:hypothetical protein [Alphaproteobacteria bacterium]
MTEDAENPDNTAESMDEMLGTIRRLLAEDDSDGMAGSPSDDDDEGEEILLDDEYLPPRDTAATGTP